MPLSANVLLRRIEYVKITRNIRVFALVHRARPARSADIYGLVCTINARGTKNEKIIFQSSACESLQWGNKARWRINEENNTLTNIDTVDEGIAGIFTSDGFAYLSFLDGSLWVRFEENENISDTPRSEK